MVVQGTPADYEDWGEGWSYESVRPYLERARITLRTAPANTDEPGPFHAAFVEAARGLGYKRLDDLDDPDERPASARIPRTSSREGAGARRTPTSTQCVDERT